MSPLFDIWKMLSGVAFLLLAMNFMENSLRLLAGRRFKLFLKTQTTSKIKAIGGGAIVTGLLQSSSIVNLLVLSMVGAGVVQMENALALMLGSNLGTTLNSWLLVTLGFNYNIENLALPVIGVAGICMAFINEESKWFAGFKFIFSLAFLFIALGYIKTGMEEFVKQTDLSLFNKYPVIVFLLLGILLTTIVQSSSATIALTLSALHTNAITLYVATAIVLGSEIGTTFKLFLASAKGLAVKKRVALGNFLFNIVTVVVIFITLRPVNYLITDVLQLKDNLYALVFFQSFVNLCCVILFFPFLQLFGKFLLKRFADIEDESFYINKVPVTDAGLAVEALENETKHLISHVIEYSLESFELKEIRMNEPDKYKGFYAKTTAEKYDYIKQLHGEIHAFYLKLQKTTTDKIETERMEQLISAIRNSMYAAKNIKDARHDIDQMRNSSNDIKYSFYLQSREKLLHFNGRLLVAMNSRNAKNHFEELTSLYQSVTAGYTETLQLFYKENMFNCVSEMEISTLINFNRQVYTSFKSILFGMKDYLLTAKEAEYFDSLPGFIR
jgi:phosphate:Na+ symporter